MAAAGPRRAGSDASERPRPSEHAPRPRRESSAASGADRAARAAAVPAPAAAAEPIDYFAALRARRSGGGFSVRAELSAGWLAEFCRRFIDAGEGRGTMILDQT